MFNIIMQNSESKIVSQSANEARIEMKVDWTIPSPIERRRFRVMRQNVKNRIYQPNSPIYDKQTMIRSFSCNIFYIKRQSRPFNRKYRQSKEAECSLASIRSSHEMHKNVMQIHNTQYRQQIHTYKIKTVDSDFISYLFIFYPLWIELITKKKHIMSK